MDWTDWTDWALVEKVRGLNPLVHNITNIVVANDSANGLLAIGASPIMASGIEELEELAQIASVVVINIGTLSTEQVTAMLTAGKAANHYGTPVVLDPVGAGATSYRKEVVTELLKEVHFDLIRGNAGEIAAIAGVDWQAKGVDSGSGSVELGALAKQAAAQYQTVVALSGEIDYISDGNRIIELANGSSLMPLMTGCGCLLSAVCGAFIAAAPAESCLEATVVALGSYSVAGELAAESLPKPASGSFRTALIDTLNIWHSHEIQERVKLTER